MRHPIYQYYNMQFYLYLFHDKKDFCQENVFKIEEGTFLCKKTSEFNFSKICDLFSNINNSSKTIIITPGYSYDFSSPYFEVKCSL